MDSATKEQIVASLRGAGAKFAYLFGSRAQGVEHPGSDIDIAAYFGRKIHPLDVLGLPGSVDLVILDQAGLELAGRVAMHGKLLFDDDPPTRVHWEATTRKIYADERPRMDQARKDFAAGAVARGRRGRR